WQHVAGVADFDQAIAARISAVVEYLGRADTDARLRALGVLEHVSDATLARLAPTLAELAVGSSKQVRNWACVLALRTGRAVVDPLRALASSTKADERREALQLLWLIGNERTAPDVVAFARANAAADASPKVTQLERDWASSEHAIGNASPIETPQ